MRLVAKGQEPGELTAFRIGPAAHPSAATITWEQFKADPLHGGMAAYPRVCQRLEENQRGLCGYCECELAGAPHDSVDHIQPKASTPPTPNWHIHWPNLLRTCKGGETSLAQNVGSSSHEYRQPDRRLSCGAKKGDTPLPLDPFGLPSARLLKFNLRTLKIEADTTACTAASVHADAVNQMIKILGLNCDRLMDARRDRYYAIQKEIRRMKDNGMDSASIEARILQVYLQPDGQGRLPKYFTLTRWMLGEAADIHLQKIRFIC